MSTDHDNVEALLRQALEFKPEERAAFLAGACGENHDLRQKVESLLSAQEEAEASLPENPTVIQSTLSEGPGSVIDRYKLLQQIGEGGMGVVYMAQQEVPVKRKVALKIIKLGMDTKNVIARFEAERQALAMMDHPNIARVLDGGATDTGRPYFVMELVQGIPITEFCDKNKLPAADRLNLLIPVCQAIQSAHQKGIIHRDIKPSNVLVTLHHGEPMAKVIDFGIAKATNQKLTEKTLFTNYAQMIGTPAYMSPEQAEMSSMDVDTRTDVYSLGVLLYELLTGTTPFSQKRLSSLAYGEMQRVIAEEEPEKPSTRLSTMEVEKKTVTAKNRGIDIVALSKQFRGDVDWIVMKCLEKDRRRRYDTPQELVADLKRFLNNEPVSAAAPSLAYQFQKLARRYKAAFAAAAAIAAIFVIGSTVATWQAIRATLAQREADAARHEALAGLERESQLLEEMRVAKDQAEAARKEADRRFYRSSIDRAQVARIRNEPGYRTETEALLQEASVLADDVKNILEMRNEAMAVMLAPYSDDGEIIATITNRPSELWRWNPARNETAKTDQSGRLWVTDLVSNEIISQLNRDSARVQSLAFGRDGNTLVSARQGGVIRIWRRSSDSQWTLLRQLALDAGESRVAVAAGKSGFVAVISGSDQLRYWKAFAEREPESHTLPEAFHHGNADHDLIALSPDEGRVAIRMVNSMSVLLWDLLKKQPTRLPNIQTKTSDQSVSMEFSPDGHHLALGAGGFAQIYRTGTFELLFERVDSAGWGGAMLNFSPDSSQLVYGANPAYIHLLGANQPLLTLPSFGRYMFSRTSGVLMGGSLSASNIVTIRQWPAVSHEFIELVGHQNSVKGVTFHPKEQLAITSSVDHTVRFWSLDDGREVQRIQTPKGASEDALFSPDGRFFVTALEDAVGTVQIRDARTTQVIQKVELGARAYSLDFSTEGNLLAISGIGVVKAWSYETAATLEATNSIKLKLVQEIQDPEMGSVTTVHLSPNGHYMAWFEAGPNNPSGIGTESTGIRIWDLRNDRELPHQIKAWTAWNSFDFTDKTGLLAVGGADGGIEIWDYVAGEKVAQLPGWAGKSEQVDVSTDGRYLAFSAPPRGFGVFDLEKKQLLFMSPILPGGAWQMRWNHDSTRLGIAQGNGQARVLNITAIRSQLAELGLDW